MGVPVTDRPAGNPGQKPIPYATQWLDDSDIQAVVEVLRSEWLTTGPKVAEFEDVFARTVGSQQAVAVSNGTAALHCAVSAINVGPGDEVIVPTMTFAATANCVMYRGGTPVFADVLPSTLLIDPTEVEAKLTPRTVAVIAVDYAGHPCDYDKLREITDRKGIRLIADACHSLGGSYKGRSVGSLADLSAFSFHPVKQVTTGEGGMIACDDQVLADRMRTFRNHGITSDHRQREKNGTWFYEMVELGWNYRITDFQCALGISQLRKLSAWVGRRREIASRYDEAFAESQAIKSLDVDEGVVHAYHLYVVRIEPNKHRDRASVFNELRDRGVLANVHYVPVHLHPFYQRRFGTGKGMCPVAEKAYEQIVSLPIFPRMTDEDVKRVIKACLEAV
jgi:perosamine synthetase